MALRLSGQFWDAVDLWGDDAVAGLSKQVLMLASPHCILKAPSFMA